MTRPSAFSFVSSRTTRPSVALAAVLLALAALAGCQQSDSSSVTQGQTPPPQSSAPVQELREGVLALVNGQEIPEARLQFYAQEAPQGAAERETLINNIITSEVIAQAAKEAGLDQREEVQAQVVVAEQVALGRAYIENYFAANAITDEQIQAHYNALAADAQNRKEYEAAHILVADEAQAQDLLAQIKKDPSVFGALAKEHSQDPGSGANDGKLGWVAPQALVPPFSEAMVALQPGEITDAPVKSDFGWHIIRLDNVRATEVPALTPEVKAQVEQSLQANLFNSHLSELQSKADIKRR